MSFPDQKKILKEVVFNLAVSMNVNTERSQKKNCPYPKYFKVTKFRDLANSRKFGTAKNLIW